MIPVLEGFADVEHDVTAIETEAGSVSAVVNLDLADVFDGLDTSGAILEIPCG